MKFFNIGKSKKQQEKDDESDWNKDIKRNKNSDEEAEQQSFIFDEYIDTTSNKDIYGTKKGLSNDYVSIKPEQIIILKKCALENSASELMKILNRTNKTKFKQTILNPLVAYGFFELTIPDKPKSPKQKYKLTNTFVNKRSL